MRMTKHCADCGYSVSQALKTVAGRVQCRSEFECVKRLKHNIHELIKAGSPMSNICFQLSMRGSLLRDRDRDLLQRLVDDWRAAVNWRPE